MGQRRQRGVLGGGGPPGNPFKTEGGGGAVRWAVLQKGSWRQVSGVDGDVPHRGVGFLLPIDAQLRTVHPKHHSLTPLVHGRSLTT